MSQLTSWKAVALGAACGIASLAAARALILPIYLLASSGSLNPMSAVGSSGAVTLTYVNLGLGLVCAGLGGYIAGRFAQGRLLFHGVLAGVGIALVNHAGLVFSPQVTSGAMALGVLTVAFGALGSYLAGRASSNHEAPRGETSNL